MKQESKARSIGIFVSLALLTLVAGVALLSSGGLFQKTDRFTVVFDRSIKGLAVGSRVTVQGVPRGQVVDIDVNYSEKHQRLMLPVTIEVLHTDLRTASGSIIGDHEAILDELGEGIRASLVPQSLVTGQLMIELVVDSELEGRLIDMETEYDQIPLLPSQFDQAGAAVETILHSLQEVKFDKIAKDLSALLNQLNKLAESPDIKQSLSQLSRASGELNQLLSNLNQTLPATTAQLNQTLESIENTAVSFNSLAKNGNTLIPAMETSLQQLNQTLAQAQATMQSYQGLVSDESELRYQMSQSLNQIQRTLYSVNELTDQIERQPTSLIFGKPEE